MAAQQQSAAQQAPQQQQLYPPPPPFYRLYIADADGSAERPLPPLPPPPLTGNYQQFGIADSVRLLQYIRLHYRCCFFPLLALQLAQC